MTSVIPNVQPVADVTPWPCCGVERLMYSATGRASVDAADDEVDCWIVSGEHRMITIRCKIRVTCFPVELMEEIDSVDQYSSLVLPNIGCSERLAYTIRSGNGISIHNCDVKTFFSPPSNQCMMQIWKSGENSTALPPTPISKMRSGRRPYLSMLLA